MERYQAKKAVIIGGTSGMGLATSMTSAAGMRPLQRGTRSTLFLPVWASSRR